MVGKGNRFRPIGLWVLGICLLLLAVLGGVTMTPSAAGRAAPTPEAFNYLPLIQHQPTPTPTATPACGPAPIDSGDLAVEAAIITGINQQRALNDRPPLAETVELTQSSRRHSLDMATQGFTGHTGSDGSKPRDRIIDACYEAVYAGEIIGWGFGGDPEGLITWWMNSQVHREMILSDNFVDYGAGYIRLPGSDWTHYWTVNFGRRSAGWLAANERLYLCQYTVEGPLGGSSLRLLSPQPCL